MRLPNTSEHAQRAAISLLTADLGSEALRDRLIDEFAYSVEYEESRLEIGDSVLWYTLEVIAQSVQSTYPERYEDWVFEADAVELFTDLLYLGFSQAPAPLGPILSNFDPRTSPFSGVAGTVEQDYPAALNGVLIGPPDGRFQTLLIETWFLGYGAEPHSRIEWFQAIMGVASSQLRTSARFQRKEPDQLLQQWALSLTA